MSVWIDPPVWPAHGHLFSHVVSDLDYDELHEVARRAGITRRAFDGDHYDVPAHRHADLVRAGARVTTGAELVRRLNASGLRLRKRKGDRGLARLFEQPTPLGVATLDVVGSGRPHPDATALALLTPGPGSWGVPLTLAGDRPLDPQSLRNAAHRHGVRPDRAWRPIGWVRVTTALDVAIVQVLGGDERFDTLPTPWNLYQD